MYGSQMNIHYENLEVEVDNELLFDTWCPSLNYVRDLQLIELTRVS